MLSKKLSLFKNPIFSYAIYLSYPLSITSPNQATVKEPPSKLNKGRRKEGQADKEI
jgi:hypothetical protein